VNVDEALEVADDLENHDSADCPKAADALAAEVRRLRARDEAGAAVVRAWLSVGKRVYVSDLNVIRALDALARVHETGGGA